MPDASAPSASSTPSNRRYGGLSAQERRDERRKRLLDAGLDLFGTRGLRGTTIKDICAAAGLNERYFYESFSSREDLLAAVYAASLDRLSQDVLRSVQAAPAVPAARARAGIACFVQALAADPRRARIQLLEVVGVNPALERARRERLHQFAAMIETLAGELIDLSAASATDLRLLAMALVGATNELMIEWTLGDLDATPDQIIDLVTALFMSSASTLEA